MAENLKVIYYRNGDTISNVTDDSEWSNLNIGAYCSYNNDDGYINTYSLLYNWYAVNDGRNIAPAGWHVPSDEEWWTLADQLGGYSLAGHELKSTSGWYDNGNGSNSSGFNALSGGYRYDFSMFLHFGFEAGFWSSTEDTTDKARYWGLSNLHRVAYPGLVSKQYGFSVRCIRD